MHERAVIWDLDGTLIDSYQAHYKAWVQITAEYDIPYNEAIFAASFGQSNDLVLRQWLGERWNAALAGQIAERKEAAYREVARTETRLFPGALAWLQRLRQAGWSQALGSSAPWVNIDVVIEATGIGPYIDAISSAEFLPSKPDPAVFQVAAEKLGVPPARCIVVEDAPAGIEGAQRAGMRTIALTTTHAAGAFNGVDWIAAEPDALPDDIFDRLVPA